MLPGRTEVGPRSFSPWIDRFALVIFSFVAYNSYAPLSSFLGGFFGSISEEITVCLLLILVPTMATSLGKLVVRLLA